MDCEQFNSQLDAYHDGELDADRIEPLESHLRVCPACARTLRSLQAISRQMLTIPIAEMPVQVVERLHAEIDRTMDRSLLLLARSLAGIAASILVVATAGLWWMQPARASAPQPWEGAMLLPQSNDFPAASSASAIDSDLPELIVADLSRSSALPGDRR